MLRISAVALIALLAVVTTTSAQVVYDSPSTWFVGSRLPGELVANRTGRGRSRLSLTPTVSGGRPAVRR